MISPFTLELKSGKKTCVCPSGSVVTSDGKDCLCPEGYFMDSLLGCLPCDKTCQTCAGSSVNNCTSCKYPFHFENNLCVCPVGSTYDIISGRCQCPLGKWADIIGCIDCPPWKHKNKNGICVCGDGKYEDGDYCLECASGCLRCTGPEISDCIECVSGKDFDSDHECIRKGFREIYTYITLCSILPGFILYFFQNCFCRVTQHSQVADGSILDISSTLNNTSSLGLKSGDSSTSMNETSLKLDPKPDSSRNTDLVPNKVHNIDLVHNRIIETVDPKNLREIYCRYNPVYSIIKIPSRYWTRAHRYLLFALLINFKMYATSFIFNKLRDFEFFGFKTEDYIKVIGLELICTSIFSLILGRIIKNQSPELSNINFHI